MFATKEPLTPKQFEEVAKFLDDKQKIVPEGAPTLVLGGAEDYALAPSYKQYPSEFLTKWKERYPAAEIRFTTLSKYLDAVLPSVRSGRLALPTMRAGTAYDFDAFWIENPRVKGWFRRDEHALQAAEMLSTAASLNGQFTYPAVGVVTRLLVVGFRIESLKLQVGIDRRVILNPVELEANGLKTGGIIGFHRPAGFVFAGFKHRGEIDSEISIIGFVEIVTPIATAENTAIFVQDINLPENRIFIKVAGISQHRQSRASGPGRVKSLCQIFQYFFIAHSHGLDGPDTRPKG